MSRIGKLPIAIPDGVRVSLKGAVVQVEGPKGKLAADVPQTIHVNIEENHLRISRETEARKSRALHGLTRKLIANMVEGVSRGFSRTLEINGVGYRAEIKGSDIHFSLGYSHPILFPLPTGVTATVDRQTILTVTSADRELLGKTAARIRQLRPPEPYKGKGIKYREETIQRKAGKAVGAAGSS
ncbi:MAG: 50S ribosomal protein L6 [Deltaproteobacteria bacterium]|nr:50S ribosomal protein L6 [Deltaproteobacteria bacterium]